MQSLPVRCRVFLNCMPRSNADANANANIVLNVKTGEKKETDVHLVC